MMHTLFVPVILLVSVTPFNIDTQSPQILTNTNGLFGFSTAFHKSASKDYVLVGSPNGESGIEGVKQPGVVYKCPLNTNSNESIRCDSMVNVFNDGGNLYESGFQQEEKSGQFLGVTLNSVDEFVVACAHRYINIFRPELYENPSHQPIGRCILVSYLHYSYFPFVASPVSQCRNR